MRYRTRTVGAPELPEGMDATSEGGDATIVGAKQGTVKVRTAAKKRKLVRACARAGAPCLVVLLFATLLVLHCVLLVAAVT